jgi:hypothetical protein
MFHISRRVKPSYQRWLNAFQVFFCAGVIFLGGRAGAEVKYTVAVYFANPLRDNTVDSLRPIIENSVKDELETIEGLKVDVVTEKDVKTGQQIEDLISQNKYSYYLKGEFKMQAGDEWFVTVDAFDIKDKSSQPPSSWTRHHQPTLRIQIKSSINDIKEQAGNIREAFGKLIGIKQVRVILISCFVTPLGQNEPKLKILQYFLPVLLPGSLKQALEKKGYRPEGMDPLEVDSLCIQARDPARLYERRRAAYYVVEGFIYAKNSQWITVTPTVWKTGRSEKMGKDPPEWEINKVNETLFSNDLAKFIINNWETIEKAFK